MRRFFEIHDVERLFRIGDDIGDLRRVLRECADAAQRGDVGAAGKKSQEGAAIRILQKQSRHGR